MIFSKCYDIFEGNLEKIKLINKFNFYFCLALLFLDIIWIFSYFTEEYDEINGVGPTFLTKVFTALSVIVKGFTAVLLKNKNQILNFLRKYHSSLKKRELLIIHYEIHFYEIHLINQVR